MIAKQLAVTINKNNTTAVSAASKPHNRLLKSKTFISKLILPRTQPSSQEPFINCMVTTLRTSILDLILILG